MCRVIAVANQKGGVGKTTTCVNLGIGLARAGKKVLLVEADAQGSMAVSLGIAVYQLKNIPENRKIRFRPYSALHEKGIRIQYKDYEQVYLARMHPEDGLEQIRRRFNEKLPRTFHGHSISVSDVLVLNKGGVVTSYYVEKDGFTVIAGFIRISSSGTLVSLDTTDFHIKGKEGKWLAFDSIIIEGRQFFLMEHETYGKEVAWVVLDEKGKWC